MVSSVQRWASCTISSLVWPLSISVLPLLTFSLLVISASLQFPGWSQGAEGSLVIALGNEDALGEYSCTPYNSLGTAGPSPVTRVLLKVRLGGQGTEEAPHADTWWAEGCGGASQSVYCSVAAAAVRCRPGDFLQSWCWEMGRQSHSTSRVRYSFLPTPTNLDLGPSREAPSPSVFSVPPGNTRVRDVVRDETGRRWDWEAQEGDSSVREALPDAGSGLQAPPAFLERPKEEYFQEVGRELLIPCSARGDPPPTVSWAKVRLRSPLCLYSAQCVPAPPRPGRSVGRGTWEGKGSQAAGEEAGAARRDKWRPW